MLGNNAEQQEWKGRGRLERMVAELERQKASRLDFVAATPAVTFVPAEEKGHIDMLLPVELGDEYAGERVRVSDHSLGQIAAKTKNVVNAPGVGLRNVMATPGIPVKFIRELTACQPQIAADLINKLHGIGQERRLSRILSGRLRAWLSDSYRMVDNYDVAFHALDTARACGGEVIESRLTEQRMSIQFTTREVAGTVIDKQNSVLGAPGSGANHEWLKTTNLEWGNYNPPEGTVHPVITVSNSETGNGGFTVSIGVLVAFCINMAVVSTEISKIHIGQKLEEGMYQQDTIKTMSEAIVLQTRDIMRKAFDARWFHDLCDQMQESTDRVVMHPVRVVTNLCKDTGLNEENRDAILSHFMRGGSHNAWGVGQAVARTAQDVTDADIATFLEGIAGSVLVGGQKLSEKEVKVK